MDVSIIIVNFNTCELLCECIQSIQNNTFGIEYEIIVSDNKSSDSSVEVISNRFSNITIIENPYNLGFGAANNKALKIAKGKYIFFLNSDTILLNNSVKIFYDYFERNANEKLGALGSNLLTPDGQITASWSNFFSFKHDILRFIYDYLLLFCFWKKEIKNKKKEYKFYEGDVDIIIGADLFMKNNQFAYFDEYFFLYHEESDLQLRLSNNGFKRRIIAGPEIVHLEGGSKKSVLSKYDYYITFSRIHDRISRVKFYKKNGKKYQYKVLLFLLKMIWYFPTIKKYTKKYIGLLRAI